MQKVALTRATTAPKTRALNRRSGLTLRCPASPPAWRRSGGRVSRKRRRHQRKLNAPRAKAISAQAENGLAPSAASAGTWSRRGRYA